MRKLPWEPEYIKIAFHAVVTVIVIYSLKLLLDFFIFVLAHMDVVTATLGQFFSLVGAAFAPLLIAFVIAYVLNPLVDFFQKATRSASLKRTWGTALTYAVFGLPLVGILLFFMYRVSQSPHGSFSGQMAYTVNNMEDTYTGMQLTLVEWGVFDYAAPYLSSFVNFVRSTGQGLVAFLADAGSVFLNLLLAVFIAFYLMRDKEFIKDKCNKVLNACMPFKAAEFIRRVLRDIHYVFSGYIRGQLMDAVIVAILIGTFLYFLGVPFGVLIGVITGVSNLIPYFGAVVGFVLAVLSALLAGEPMTALWAAIGVLVIQQIDGLIIQPKIVGLNVKLGPVAVILSLSVGGRLFGFWGMVWAVPVCALLKMFLANWLAGGIKHDSTTNL